MLGFVVMTSGSADGVCGWVVVRMCCGGGWCRCGDEWWVSGFLQANAVVY